MNQSTICQNYVQNTVDHTSVIYGRDEKEVSVYSMVLARAVTAGPMHTAHSINPTKEGAYKPTLFAGVVMPPAMVQWLAHWTLNPKVPEFESSNRPNFSPPVTAQRRKKNAQ
jgi:hypothetical protein